jgi:hypothetical protein
MFYRADERGDTDDCFQEEISSSVAYQLAEHDDLGWRDRAHSRAHRPRGDRPLSTVLDGHEQPRRHTHHAQGDGKRRHTDDPRPDLRMDRDGCRLRKIPYHRQAWCENDGVGGEDNVADRNILGNCHRCNSILHPQGTKAETQAWSLDPDARRNHRDGTRRPHHSLSGRRTLYTADDRWPHHERHHAGDRDDHSYHRRLADRHRPNNKTNSLILPHTQVPHV